MAHVLRGPATTDVIDGKEITITTTEVVATCVSGETAVISNQMLVAPLPKGPTISTCAKIVQTRNAPDGALSVVTVKDCLEGQSVLRLKDSAADVRDALKQAGLPAPEIRQQGVLSASFDSIRHRLSLKAHTYRGPLNKLPVEP